MNRRTFLNDFVGGLGTIALWHLLAQDGRAASTASRPVDPLAPQSPHRPATIKNVIFIFAEGGPSQFDLFVPKPEMRKWDGHPLPDSLRAGLGQKLAFIRPTARVWASPRVFSRHGESGMPFSDWLPHLATCADDICMVHSVETDQFNHSTGQLMMHCGTPMTGRPSLGAWSVYGLGSDTQNLPAYVVLGKPTAAGTGIWSSGFLPSTFAGVPFLDKGDPVLYLSSPAGISRQSQGARLAAIRDLSHIDAAASGESETLARLACYELAFRMQTAAPELMDLRGESAETLRLYGVNQKLTHEFATRCLLARRLVERGVRFVTLISSGWDHHTDLMKLLKQNCDCNDQPTAALLKDLKRRGLLDSTLVIWGGEFGRTPLVEDHGVERGAGGRDHHPSGFTMWLAGGSIQAGKTVGRTDDLGLNVIEDRIPIHDLHATILHCLGLDHKRLTFRHQGRDFRLTDVSGEVAQQLVKT